MTNSQPVTPQPVPSNPLRIIPCTGASDEIETLLSHEWLVTNGLGGYASGTLSGVCTRKYHGLLIAALPAPVGRMVMLTSLFEELVFPNGRVVELGGEERSEKDLYLPGARLLREFRLDMGLPVWRYETCGLVIEKRVFLPYLQNTVYVNYRLISGKGPVRLRLRPSMHFRQLHTDVNNCPQRPYTFKIMRNRYEIKAEADGDFPQLRTFLYGRERSFDLIGRGFKETFYRVEQRRGYACCGNLWSPGSLEAVIQAADNADNAADNAADHAMDHAADHATDHAANADKVADPTDTASDTAASEVTLVASTEPWEVMLAIEPREALEAEVNRRLQLLAAAHPNVQSGPAAELVLAADQFIVVHCLRSADKPDSAVSENARPAKDHAATIIAGYHWFTDWGRDTMISLEGLTLTTGRSAEAGHILRNFGSHVRDGLIPNVFPEGQAHGEYNTADATLWFFYAVDRYLLATKDSAMLSHLLPILLDIMDRHLAGTCFGIGVDPLDGLLRQGEAGYQLTWMDAKVGDWVVTPRRGKAVEINALWYNALRLLEGWVRTEMGAQKARPIADKADQVYDSFNRRFWYEEGGYLYDVVDGENGVENDVENGVEIGGGNVGKIGAGSGYDASLRPNQILAISLPYPVLDPFRWESVLEVVRKKLLTPFGLRSLSPDHPDYRKIYYGDIRARDTAYHQGTVWPWLIGPFIDAWLRKHPGDRAGGRRFLDGLVAHLDQACIGSISEVFDADPPFNPEGCVSQAWSVAQMLLCWIKTNLP